MSLFSVADRRAYLRGPGYAVAALDVVNLDFMGAVIGDAAIASLTESHFEHYGFELLMATVAARRRRPAPLAIRRDSAAPNSPTNCWRSAAPDARSST